MIKKIFIVLFVIAVGFLIYQVKDTYSLFETNVGNSISKDISKWHIVINDTNVSSTISNTFPISSIIWQESVHVQTGKVAPGVNGYFDIVIDPNTTEVSVRYDITYDLSFLVNEEFNISNIEEITSNNLVRTGEFTYTGVILLADISTNTTHTVRTTLTWNNDETNNANDTLLGEIANNSVSIPVTVNISQYLGEAITPYVETP